MPLAIALECLYQITIPPEVANLRCMQVHKGISTDMDGKRRRVRGGGELDLLAADERKVVAEVACSILGEGQFGSSDTR